MASACVNASLAVAPPVPDTSSSSFGWLSPRVSFSSDQPEPAAAADALDPSLPPPPPEGSASTPRDLVDFEFRLDSPAPAAMLPADELFADGKLIPLQPALVPAAEPDEDDEQAPAPPPLVSSSKWKELWGLRKQQGSKSAQPESSPAAKTYSRSLRRFLRRNPNTKSAPELSMSLPLLRDSQPPAAAAESGGQTDKSVSGSNSNSTVVPPKVRLSKARSGQPPPAVSVSAAAADSPRLNAAGKVVYQGLGRSSSSPSSLSGGARAKHRGIERSYSAGVRVAPVLNVPVCSLRGSRRPTPTFGVDGLFTSAVPPLAGKGKGKAEKDKP